jgi:hypothetical protein
MLKWRRNGRITFFSLDGVDLKLKVMAVDLAGYPSGPFDAGGAPAIWPNSPPMPAPSA